MRHVTIPKQWTGKDGLKFVAFLERLIQAIWLAHGRDMAFDLEIMYSCF